MKKYLSDLAIFGGNAAFQEKLHVGRPNIGDRQQLLARINDLLDRKWLSNNGPYVQEFEKKIADMVGVKHCIAMCNGTIALEIAIRALGLKGEVIVPSFTFIATAHALQWQEITPVFCDINPHTHTIDENCIERMITPHTTGIIGVHTWGKACNVEALFKLAQKHNLGLLFDAAHAFGCSYHGKMIGNFGDAEVFSFHATKFLNTFEGGAVVTNNDALAEKIRLMKNFGFAGYDNVIHIGTNGKMSEISAAMGLTGLDSLHEFIEVNHQNYNLYKNRFSNIAGIKLLEYDQHEKNNYQYIVLEIDENITQVSRDQLLDILWHENVLARRYFFPGSHLMQPYASYFPHAGLLLDKTAEVCQKIMILPTGTSISLNEIDKICQIIEFTIEHQAEVLERLSFKREQPVAQAII